MVYSYVGHNIKNMEPIIFNKDKSDKTLSYSGKPILNIIRINFLSNDKQWTSRLFNALITIKITALDKDKNELASQQTPLSLGTFITPYHKQPVLEVNKTFSLSPEIGFHNLQSSNSWKIEIVLSNLKFNDEESLTCEYMDTSYIKQRVDDWQTRVHDLIKLIEQWSENNNSVKIKPTRKQKMHEGLMKTFEVPMVELESADIQINSKTVIVLKPFGLWIMGANGRVDLLTAKGNFVLVDEADKFQTPKWKLYLKSDKKQGIDFTKESFYQLLGL